MTIHVADADESDLDELVDVAARTFPLACPPSAEPADIAAFIATQLTLDRFAGYLRDPHRKVLIARNDQRISGYAMLIRGVGTDPDVRRAVTGHPAVELSKMYVLPDAHGAGIAAALMRASLTAAQTLGAVCVWLGVNQENQRAQRFYGKHGFTRAGTKTFQLGARIEHDYVMTCALVKR